MSFESPPRMLSEWLQLMLAEITAKREALERAAAEEARRRAERAPQAADSRAGARPS
jgi:hypothetical protein